MTNEEKAEEYYWSKEVIPPNKKSIEQAYLDGLAEGRKEKCLEQNKDGTIRPCEVMKENEELKAQIEKMKNFIFEEVDFCSYCPLTNECENNEVTCPYAYATEEEQKKILAEWIIKNGS